MERDLSHLSDADLEKAHGHWKKLCADTARNVKEMPSADWQSVLDGLDDGLGAYHAEVTRRSQPTP